MKNMKKFLCSALAFILIMSMFTLYANAADALISYSVSSSSIAVGSEFTTTLSVTNVGPFTSGFNALAGYVSFESDYVELVSITSARADLFESPQHNSKNNKFSILSKQMDLVPAGPVINIKFKLKARPETNIKVATISSLTLTDGVDELSFDPVSITLKVSEPPTPSDNNTTGGNTTGNNTTGGNTTGGNTSGNNTTGGNTSGGNTSGGNTSGNNTTGGNTSGGNTSGNNTTGGNTTGGNTSRNNTTGGNTSGGNAAKNNTTGGNTSGGGNGNGGSSGGTSGNGNGSGSSSSKGITGSDGSTSSKKIPHAGFSKTVVFFIAVTSVAGTVAYFRFKNLKLR